MKALPASSSEVDIMSNLSFFVDSNESYVCSLGNTFLQHFLTGGGIRKGFAVVSDKRVYFKGECLSAKGAKFMKSWEERVVDIKDVTGTGYERVSMLNVLLAILIYVPFLLILAFSLIMATDAGGVGNPAGFAMMMLLFFVIPPAVINIVLFLSRRTNVFTIAFAGGKIAFDTKWYDKAEVDEFQRSIRLTKDREFQQQTPHTAPLISAQNTSTADELQKLAALFAQGAITQDEFNKLKANLIN